MTEPVCTCIRGGHAHTPVAECPTHSADPKMTDCPSPLGMVCKDPSCRLHFRRPLRRLLWDYYGVDEGGLPEHLPMGVTEAGEGPTGDAEAHHYECWCADPKCLLTQALELAWQAGRRSAR